MRNKLQTAANHFENQLELMRHYAEDYPDNNYTAITDIYATAIAALGMPCIDSPTPSPAEVRQVIIIGAATVGTSPRLA